MVSCLLTRVFLNVSVALTIQCHQPNGSIYNKTICSMLPSNMAKLEILKDILKEYNVSVPRSLIPSTFGLQHQGKETVYISYNKTNSAQMNELHTLNVQGMNSTENNIVSEDSLDDSQSEKNIELNARTSIKNTQKIDESLNSSDEKIEVASTIFCSDIYKREKFLDSNSSDEIKDNSISHYNSNRTHVFSNKRQDLHSETSAERSVQSDQSQYLKNEVDSTESTLNVNTIWNLSDKNDPLNITDLFLTDDESNISDAQYEVGKFRNFTPLFGDQKTRNYHWTENLDLSTKRDLTELKNVNTLDQSTDNFMSPDFCTKFHYGNHEIEKRSIPNTIHEYDKDVKINQMNPSIDEKDNQNVSNFATFDFNAYPGERNFWDIYVTSPVEVILNSTDIFENENVANNISEYEKIYYNNLVKNLAQKYNREGSKDPEYDYQLRTNKKNENLNSRVTIADEFSREVENIIKDIPNASSLERNVAMKILQKMTKEPVQFHNLEKRLGTKKYSEYLHLKKLMDSQYKEIREQLNKTEEKLSQIIYEMRGLKKEKKLDDYFYANQDYFTHLTKPQNYTCRIDYVINDSKSESVNQHSRIANETYYYTGKIEEYSSEEEIEETTKSNFLVLDDSKPFDRNPAVWDTDLKENTRRSLVTPGPNEIILKMMMASTTTEHYDIKSLEKYDKKKERDNEDFELKQEKIKILSNVSRAAIDKFHESLLKKSMIESVPDLKPCFDDSIQNISQAEIDKVHESLLKRRMTKSVLNLTKLTTLTVKQTRKPWFDESLFDKNDPKIQYAKYLYNVRNISVKLNMEVGKKQIRTISYFDKENLQYAHQFKQTTEHRRFSHMIPFWLTQPKEIEDIFKGNTKIFREYIQYILDKHNFTELPVHGRFAFLRRYINRLNNPLIFNRITIFPTPYTTTHHVRTFRDQLKHFKMNVKHKLHQAYKHVKHFLFHSNVSEETGHVQVENTKDFPDEIVINITTPIPPYYDYYRIY